MRNADGTPHHCEDPYLWKSKRGWHLLTHNQQGPQGVSSYGFSVDGHNWTLSPKTPYQASVTYSDGSTQNVGRCERPQIVWGGGSGPDAGTVPQWLINGASGAKPGGGAGTWTLVRKLAEA